MKKRTTDFQANTPFLEHFNTDEVKQYVVSSKERQTSKHTVRQINIKTTFFYTHDEKN